MAIKKVYKRIPGKGTQLVREEQEPDPITQTVRDTATGEVKAELTEKQARNLEDIRKHDVGGGHFVPRVPNAVQERFMQIDPITRQQQLTQEKQQFAQGIESKTGPLAESIRELATPGNEPSLESPLSTTEKISGLALSPSTAIGNFVTAGLEKVTGKKFGRTKASDFAQTKFGKALGLSITGTAAALALAGGAAGLRAVVAGSAKASIGTAVLDFGITIAALGGSIIGFGKVLDLNRGEINEMVNVANGMTIAGERAQALAINSPEDIPFVVQQLEQMNNDLIYAESVIKQKSIYNFKYAGSQEYFNDQIAFRNARNALLRRLAAVENIAETGAAPGNLDDYILSEMMYYEKYT